MRLKNNYGAVEAGGVALFEGSDEELAFSGFADAGSTGASPGTELLFSCGVVAGAASPDGGESFVGCGALPSVGAASEDPSGVSVDAGIWGAADPSVAAGSEITDVAGAAAASFSAVSSVFS